MYQNELDRCVIGTDGQTKSAFLFTNVDVINYCLQNFIWAQQTIINLMHALYVMRVGFIKFQDSVRV